MEKQKVFTMKDLMRIFGVKKHFILRIVETGIIQPLKDARGRGRSRIYSWENVLQFGIFIELSKLQIAYDGIRWILGQVKKNLETKRQSIDDLRYISVIEYWGGTRSFSLGWELNG